MQPKADAVNARERLRIEWPEPLTAKQWDQRFPGILDGVSLIGGAANVILQLSRLPVGYGVVESKVESGSLFAHPFKRFRTTITYLSVALMGNTAEKLAYRQAINGQHAQVRSNAESPVEYNAFDPALQLWVAACIYWGMTDINAKFRGRMSDEKRAELLQLSEGIGTTLQVRPADWPQTPAAFDMYWAEGLATLNLDDTVRGFLTEIADLKFLPAPLRLGSGRLRAGGCLPTELRKEMRFEWGAEEQRKFDRQIRWIARLNRLLPRIVRQAPALWAMWDLRRRIRRGKPLV